MSKDYLLRLQKFLIDRFGIIPELVREEWNELVDTLEDNPRDQAAIDRFEIVLKEMTEIDLSSDLEWRRQFSRFAKRVESDPPKVNGVVRFPNHVTSDLVPELVKYGKLLVDLFTKGTPASKLYSYKRPEGERINHFMERQADRLHYKVEERFDEAAEAFREARMGNMDDVDFREDKTISLFIEIVAKAEYYFSLIEKSEYEAAAKVFQANIWGQNPELWLRFASLVFRGEALVKDDNGNLQFASSVTEITPTVLEGHSSMSLSGIVNDASFPADVRVGRVVFEFYKWLGEVVHPVQFALKQMRYMHIKENREAFANDALDEPASIELTERLVGMSEDEITEKVSERLIKIERIASDLDLITDRTTDIGFAVIADSVLDTYWLYLIRHGAVETVNVEQRRVEGTLGMKWLSSKVIQNREAFSNMIKKFAEAVAREDVKGRTPAEIVPKEWLALQHDPSNKEVFLQVAEGVHRKTGIDLRGWVGIFQLIEGGEIIPVEQPSTTEPDLSIPVPVEGEEAQGETFAPEDRTEQANKEREMAENPPTLDLIKGDPDPEPEGYEILTEDAVTLPGFAEGVNESERDSSPPPTVQDPYVQDMIDKHGFLQPAYMYATDPWSYLSGFLEQSGIPVSSSNKEYGKPIYDPFIDFGFTPRPGSDLWVATMAERSLYIPPIPANVNTPRFKLQGARTSGIRLWGMRFVMP